MFKIIKEFFLLLTPSQRKRFYLLQMLVIIMAFAEIAAIMSIAPFMSLVGNISILSSENFLSKLYIISGLNNPYQFVFYLGIGVLITLTIAAVISICVSWRLAIFGSAVGAEISDRLYSYYLDQNWLFHSMGSSSILTEKIATESERVTNYILLPLMQINARFVLSLFISSAMIIYNPYIAAIGIIIFIIAYVVLFKIVRSRLHRNGQNISKMYMERFKLMNEGFGGIKDVLLLGRSSDFKKRFTQSGKLLTYSKGTNIALTQIPRYFMELLAFGSMITLVLYLVINSKENLNIILPTLSVYALAGMKLLPAFQQVYSNLALIKGNLPAYEAIRADLKKTKNINLEDNVLKSGVHNWDKSNEIKLNNIRFKYPTKTDYFAIKNVSLTIKANSVIGFVGTSGSGKSTLIDIIIGLIEPLHGEILIDGCPLTKNNVRAWQDKIGFVPQSIFLTEGSIAENVAFGIEQNQIDFVQVKKALKLAHLDDLVSGLELGIHTKVGERGVQLSGGQRQRIGIARALYYEADILVFDEATSALDGMTEKVIMDAIHDFTDQKTLIMIAHRLKTVQKCDQIFVMEKGQVVDSGTYQELLDKNELFKKMSSYA